MTTNNTITINTDAVENIFSDIVTGEMFCHANDTTINGASISLNIGGAVGITVGSASGVLITSCRLFDGGTIQGTLGFEPLVTGCRADAAYVRILAAGAGNLP